MNAPIPMKKLKDYYWAYSDILQDIGINESAISRIKKMSENFNSNSFLGIR